MKYIFSVLLFVLLTISCKAESYGACCLFDNSYCVITTAYVCGSSSGTYMGDTTTCQPDTCPITGSIGACCWGSACRISSESLCFNDFQGKGTGCSPNPCGLEFAIGACCDSVTKDCYIMDEVNCGKLFLGSNTICNPIDICGFTETPDNQGACCFDGNCFIGSALDCQGTFGGYFIGIDTVCSQDLCSTEIEWTACCDPSTLTCYIIPLSLCIHIPETSWAGCQVEGGCLIIVEPLMGGSFYDYLNKMFNGDTTVPLETAINHFFYQR